MNNYRPDIDGLRAVAVVSVIFFHYKIPYFTGGFIGVDVFFVISGYLISSIIFHDLAANKFSFAAFYERRIRRIFPALFAVIFVSTILGFILYDYTTLLFFGKSLIATVIFASNFYFYKNEGYFIIPAQQNTLLHTWSLAVEEQFYLLFPIFIYFLYQYRSTKINYYILTGILFSFIICLIFTENYPNFSFFLLPTRVWEFLAGTLLAAQFFPSLSNPKLYNILSVIGLGLIIVSVFTFSSDTIYPGYYALFPVLGTCLLIYSSENNRRIITSNFLEARLIVFIGKISYSLYLWHWILYVFCQYLFINAFNSLIIIILLLTLFIISFLSWRFIEQRFRYNRVEKSTIERTHIFIGALGVSVVFLLVGVSIYKNKNIEPWRFTENKLLMEAQKDSLRALLEKREKNFSLHFNELELPYKLGNQQKIPRLMIWGDSHAKMLVEGLEAVAKANNASLYFVGLGGYLPLQEVDRPFKGEGKHPTMSFLSKQVLQFIVTHSEIKTVLLIGRWSAYIGHDNQYDRTPTKFYSTNKSWENYKGNNLQLMEKGLRETIDALRTAKRKVILITDVPQLECYPVNLVVRRRYTGENLNDLTPTKATYELNNRDIFNLFEKLKKEGLVDEIIPLHQQFLMNNKTIIEENNHLLYRDDDHLSYWGSMKVRGLFAKYMKNDN